MLKERNYYKDELEKANVVITQQDEKLEKAVKTNLELSNDYNKLAANYSNLQNLSRSALAKLNATVGTRDAKIQQLESELAQEKNTTTGLRKTVSNNEEKIQQLESELAQEKDKVGELTEVLLKTSEIVSSSNQNLEESIKARESSSQVPEVNIENVKLDEDLLKYLSDINAGNV
jgi:chromosome segregation ATPase